MTPTRSERRYWLWHSFVCLIGCAGCTGLAVASISTAVSTICAVLAVAYGWVAIGSFARFVLENLRDEGNPS